MHGTPSELNHAAVSITLCCTASKEDTGLKADTIHVMNLAQLKGVCKSNADTVQVGWQM